MDYFSPQTYLDLGEYFGRIMTFFQKSHPILKNAAKTNDSPDMYGIALMWEKDRTANHLLLQPNTAQANSSKTCAIHALRVPLYCETKSLFANTTLLNESAE